MSEIHKQKQQMVEDVNKQVKQPQERTTKKQRFYKQGDLVWLKRPLIELVGQSRLEPQWKGPAKVFWVGKQNLFKINLHGKKSLQHGDNLRPFYLLDVSLLKGTILNLVMYSQLPEQVLKLSLLVGTLLNVVAYSSLPDRCLSWIYLLGH